MSQLGEGTICCEELTKVHQPGCLDSAGFWVGGGGYIVRSNSALATVPTWVSLIFLRRLGRWIDLWLGLCSYLIQSGWKPKAEIKSGEAHSLGAGLG